MNKLSLILLLILPLSLGAKENQNLTKVKVACIGDSITFGAKVQERKNNSYPAQLQKILGNGFSVRNFGRSGSTIQLKPKLSYPKLKQFSQVKEWAPDIIIIKLGTNDANQSNHNWQGQDAFQKDYETFIDSCSQLQSKPKIYLCTVAPSFNDPGNREEIITDNVNPTIKEIASKHDLQLIDVFSALRGKKELFPDSLHPNAQGAKIIAQTVAESIQPMSENTHKNLVQSQQSSHWQIPSNKEKLHIIITMGQSNMTGFGHIKEEDKKPVPNIVYLPTKYKGDLRFLPAKHPINNRLKSHRFGLQIPFAIEYLKTNPDVKVALIPLAWGGAKIQKLNKGTAVYNDAMEKIAFAKKFGTLKAVLWHQGESDSVNDTLASSYEGKLHQLISDLRSDLNAPQLPFIVGNLAEFYGIGRNESHLNGIKKIKSILEDLPSNVPHTGFVSSSGLKSIDKHNVHFDRESFIEFGKRYARELSHITHKKSN
ncbi:sialate O-acetylesterase [Rubritalea tangerina]|uniref:Sialate O-acetylesterase n=2 Tax=Rubritalea tangerina TaxID=430798 RepID=A0ABW4Z9L8_9BACT